MELAARIFEDFRAYPDMQVSIDPGDEPVPEGAKDFFNRHGFLVIKNFIDPEELYQKTPKERGKISYFGSTKKFTHEPIEYQVKGSLSRYAHPKYKPTHSKIRIILQQILGEELYNTYYYDRFYFLGQDLKRHTDRGACEISVSIQVSKSSNKPWSFCLKTLEGREVYANLNDGDAIVYMGCEVEHWRTALKSKYNFVFKYLRKLIREPEYHHQIFFHYVRANGEKSHLAFDASV